MAIEQKGAMLSVEEVLGGLRDVPNVFYSPNGGNAGDSLINLGFYQLAERLGLQFSILDRNNISAISDDAIVIVPGGGCLVPEWPATPELVSGLSARGIRTIILPQSIRGVGEVVQNLPAGSIVFCREAYSYEYCKSLTSSAKIFIADDMAFYADFDEILNLGATQVPLTGKNIIRECAFAYHLAKSKVTSTLFAFRCDKERSRKSDVTRRWINDISSVARIGTGSRNGAAAASKRFLQILSLYETIHSDRLHVVIASARLGKRVFAYDNSYYKVRGVFERSLKGKYRVDMVSW